MKLTFLHSLALTGLLGCSGARGAELTPSVLVPVSGQIVVKEVSGQAQYAYDSTGWKALEAGKTLQAGATIKTAPDSAVVLKNVAGANFIRVDAGKTLHLTVEPPVEEVMPVKFARTEKAAARKQQVGETQLFGRNEFALSRRFF